MAIVATPGSPTANSYLTIAAADAIAESQGLGEAATAWLAAIDADKEKALIRATTEIDAYVRVSSIQYDPEQALLFPRASDVDAALLPYIDRNVELATFWQAVHVLRNADQIDRANSRRARGLISFSDDDGSGSVVSVKPEFGMIASQALAYLRAVAGSGVSTLKSVPIRSSYQ